MLDRFREAWKAKGSKQRGMNLSKVLGLLNKGAKVVVQNIEQEVQDLLNDLLHQAGSSITSNPEERTKMLQEWKEEQGIHELMAGYKFEKQRLENRGVANIINKNTPLVYSGIPCRGQKTGGGHSEPYPRGRRQ